MSELYLIRHGQASFGSANYDRLSDLGYQQSVWLGEYFRERDIHPDRLLLGSLERHRQTAEGICEGLGRTLDLEIHEGFNELDFHQLTELYSLQNPSLPAIDATDIKQFFGRLRPAMQSWISGELQQPPESWQQFCQRVNDALDRARDGGANRQIVLAVSSGGAIATALMQLMGFGGDTMIDINLQARNTGFTHCFFNAKKTYVTGFNAIPHLDQLERRAQITST